MSAPRAEAATTIQEGWGSATVAVYHSETGAPLAGLPVTVREFVKPGDRSPPAGSGTKGWVVQTDKFGNAEFWKLPEGRYEAFVFYNNVLSEPARFEIIGDMHPYVRLSFNPDID